MKKCLITLMLAACAAMFLACAQQDEVIEMTSQEEMLSGEAGAEAVYGQVVSDNEVETTCFIYVCGAVVKPGVYEVEAGTRLFQVLELAGGMHADAVPDALNLAEIVTDGMKVKIPTVTEWETQEETMDNGSVSDGLININTASKEQLMTMPGIGEAKALAVISYRETEGKFHSKEDIQKVEGIKSGVYQKIKELIKVD